MEGEKSEELGEGYKLYYSAATADGRNGVGNIVLRWLSGMTTRDRQSNTRIRGTVKVAEVSKKVQEARLRWYGHVLTRDEEGVERRVMDTEVQGRRGRGRPKTR